MAIPAMDPRYPWLQHVRLTFQWIILILNLWESGWYSIRYCRMAFRSPRLFVLKGHWIAITMDSPPQSSVTTVRFQNDGDIWTSWPYFNSLRLPDAYMRQQTYQHWFRWWLVTWPAPSHYLNQCWNIVNLTQKLFLKMSYAKCRPFSPDFNVLI